MGCLLVFIIWLGIMIVDFFLTAGAVWLICFAFGFVFSWKIVLGVWAIVAILHSIFSKSIHVKKD